YANGDQHGCPVRTTNRDAGGAHANPDLRRAAGRGGSHRGGPPARARRRTTSAASGTEPVNKRSFRTSKRCGLKRQLAPSEARTLTIPPTVEPSRNYQVCFSLEWIREGFAPRDVMGLSRLRLER